MNLDSALSIASSGLGNIDAQLALVSHNVANASTPGYVTETGTQQALDAGGIGMGVVTGPATRSVDTELQTEVYSQNAAVAGLQVTQTALSALDAVSGTPGQGSDLASLLGKLQDQFSTLLNSPDNATQQSQVVATAGTLAQGINTVSNAYTAQRQTAEDSIVNDVTTINTTLGTIGALSNQIMTAQASGQSTADLQNQRDAQVASLSQMLNINVLQQPNGDMLITTAGGVELPIHGQANPLSTTGATMQAGVYYPGGGVPAITLGGTDVTGALQGGQLGADITLRDATLPTDQAELDEFAQNLSSGFASQGLPLFTDGSGNVPAGGGTPVQTGYVGFAAAIQVNPAVQANPEAVRDGIPSQNPSGLAGFNTVITQVLDNTFGPLSGSHTTGLGPTGTLNAPYVAPTTLGGLATALIGAQSAASADATSQLTTEQAVQTTLQSKLSGETGVNLDTEMSNMIALQNAYGANARVMNVVQSMFTELLGTVSG